MERYRKKFSNMSQVGYHFYRPRFLLVCLVVRAFGRNGVHRLFDGQDPLPNLPPKNTTQHIGPVLFRSQPEKKG